MSENETNQQIRTTLAKLMKYVQICNTIDKPMG